MLAVCSVHLEVDVITVNDLRFDGGIFICIADVEDVYYIRLVVFTVLVFLFFIIVVIPGYSLT